MTACPTCAANPSATRITPREKSIDESTAMVIASGTPWWIRWFRYATAAPPGFGPTDDRTATARGTTLRTSPQLEQVSICAERPSPHIGQITPSSSLQRSHLTVPDG